MKIVFFLSSRYPTHKAYGVTTGETARAFREKGNQVKLIAPSLRRSKLNQDQYGNDIKLIYSPILKILRNSFFDLWLLSRPMFVLTGLAFTKKCKKFLREEKPDVIWVRDFWSALMIQRLFSQCKLVIEIHQTPSLLSNLVLKRLCGNQNIAFLTIQDSLKINLMSRYPSARIFLGSMGASKDFYEVGKAKLNTSPRRAQEVLKVCYLGRLTSSGHDNGIKTLLDDWQNVPENIASLTLIGLSSDEVDEISNQQRVNNVNFVTSLSHLEVPKALANYDCGLIPYPEGKYHESRFPIKIVEYCATALNIIANCTQGNQANIKESFADFYFAGNSESLISALNKIKEFPLESREKVVAGYIWAQDYTYSKRLTEIYPFLEGRSN